MTGWNRFLDQGETLAENYERTIARIHAIAEAAYMVETEWECTWDKSRVLDQKPEMLAHRLVDRTPLRTRDALYGGRTEAM